MASARVSEDTFFVGDWRVLPEEDVIERGSQSLRLEPKVMEVLVYLASRPGEVVSRNELESEVWRGALVGYDAVTSTIIKLRKALGDKPRDPSYIATVPKKGYQLIAPVKSTAASLPASPPANSSVKVEGKPTGSSVSGIHWKRLLPFFLVVIAAMVTITLYRGAYLTGEPASPEKPPTIIVLPFENISGNEQHDTFADGITEDIITDLSGLSNLKVIASNTSFALKGRKVSPLEIAKEIKVDYVLQGSIRRQRDAIRVNARLVDARSGYQKWAERFDRQVTEVFAVQDEVTGAILEALSLNLSQHEKAHLVKRATNNLAAYGHFQEGQRLSKINTPETNRQAQAEYRKAIELDPGYGRAYGALGYTMAYSYRRAWTENPVLTLDRALVLARKGVELDDTIPQTYWSLGYVQLMRKEFVAAEATLSEALAISPNYADGYGLLALIKNGRGDPKAAISLVKKGMELNPYYTWDYPYNLGRAYYALGDADRAIDLLEKARARNENAMPIRLHLAASYVRAGRQDDAEWEVEEIRSLNPKETLSQLRKAHPVEDSETLSMLLQDLRAAGLPE